MGAALHLPVRLQTAQEHEVDLDAINRHTLEPVTADDIFTFSGVCSNDRLDSYFTRMDPVTTLRNYAADLNNGVSLLGNHNIYTAPFGRSYGGQLIQDDTDNANAVRGDWYILKGVKSMANLQMILYELLKLVLHVICPLAFLMSPIVVDPAVVIYGIGNVRIFQV